MLISCIGHIQAQNLFDEGHTLMYANYLFKTGEFTTAAAEYERALTLGQGNESVKFKIISCYYKSDDYAKVISTTHSLFPDSIHLNKDISKLYMMGLYKMQRYGLVSGFVRQNENYSSQEKAWVYLNMAFIGNYFDSALTIYKANQTGDSVLFSRYSDLVKQISAFRPKKPALAAFMSTIIPGSGKVYTGEVKDGLIGFISTATWGFLAYRGFSLRGYKSGLGYTSIVFGAGFYLGNIYGSALSARRANSNKKKQWTEDAKNIFESRN